VPIGTPLRFCWISRCAQQRKGDHPWRADDGNDISSLDVPVTKGTSGVLAFGKANETPRVHACIKCGECLNVCPKFLNRPSWDCSPPSASTK